MLKSLLNDGTGLFKLFFWWTFTGIIVNAVNTDNLQRDCDICSMFSPLLWIKGFVCVPLAIWTEVHLYFLNDSSFRSSFNLFHCIAIFVLRAMIVTILKIIKLPYDLLCLTKKWKLPNVELWICRLLVLFWNGMGLFCIISGKYVLWIPLWVVFQLLQLKQWFSILTCLAASSFALD